MQRSIQEAQVPPSLARAVHRAYEALEARTRKGIALAMRSTAVGEDTEASFAGQYTTVLNVGKEALLDAYKTVLAGKYNPRAIRYRARCGLDDRATPMCVAGIAMIDALASGVCYSRDPSSPASSDVTVSAIWGLGEQLVSGEAAPDTFLWTARPSASPERRSTPNRSASFPWTAEERGWRRPRKPHRKPKPRA